MYMGVILLSAINGIGDPSAPHVYGGDPERMFFLR